MKLETKVEKQKDNTYKVDVTVLSDDVNKAYEEALRHEAENIEIKGFRKGKAPINLVKEKVDKTKLRSHALNHLLADLYKQIVTENKFKPIVQPRFNIIQFEEGKPLKLEVVIIEKPLIELKDYKKAVSKVKPDEKGEISNQSIIDAILESSEITIPEILVEEEVNRMMSSLIDQTSKMGLTVDQYLESIKKTPEDLRAQYKKSALSTLKADFLITEIAIREKIKVDDDEIEKTISSVPDAKSRELLSKPEQRLYIKAVLMKTKTLEMLKKLVGNSKVKKEKKTNPKSNKKAIKNNDASKPKGKKEEK